jgi:hypothetical protein
MELECSGACWCENPMRAVLPDGANPPVMHAGKNSAKPIETLGRRLAERFAVPLGEARERSAGGTRPRHSSVTPWKGQNPREHPADQPAKPKLVARNSRKGQSPETAARCSGLVFRTENKHCGKQHVGSFQRKRLEYLLGGESSEGTNPMSAVGMRQGRHGPGGRKPSRG